jgi:hypothetical protein
MTVGRRNLCQIPSRFLRQETLWRGVLGKNLRRNLFAAVA